MKKTVSLKQSVWLSLALCGLLAAAPALAADPPYSSGDWRGFYVGGFLGGAWSDFRNDAGVTGPSGSDSSFMGGGDIGNNWQLGRLVFGGEADFAGLNNRSDSGDVRFHENWMSTIRGRAGFDMGRLLPYATAGLGLTDIESKISGVGSNDTVDPGVTIGGGLDARVSNHWFGRIEYLYVDVPKNSETIGATNVTGGSSNNILRVGLNYKF
ncbi:MAG: outer membrane beta-barrel protein [Alphaproteobacteria bacterium]|nr:outer membrane beta-barrel protein [Alphaproteobacteria bacterium]